MMYQFIAMLIPWAPGFRETLSFKPNQKLLHHVAKSVIHQKEKQPEEKYGDDDHAGGGDDVRLGRPGYLANFHAHFVHESQQAVPLVLRANQRARAACAARIFVSHFYRRRHQFPPSSFASKAFAAAPLAEMAGEEGFEPPHPVLETGGLPLNLLPCRPYLTSLCPVCLRHDRQNFRVSMRSVCVFRFFMVV